MPHWKDALDNAQEGGHACQDVWPPDKGGAILSKPDENGLYHLSCRINGERYIAQASEDGLERVMEEFRLKKNSWFGI